MKTLKIDIAPYDEMKARTIAIARGELTAKPGEPKMWFTSTESFAKALSKRNRALLEVVAKSHPSSLQELAKCTARKLRTSLEHRKRWNIMVLCGSTVSNAVEYDQKYHTAQSPLTSR